MQCNLYAKGFTMNDDSRFDYTEALSTPPDELIKEQPDRDICVPADTSKQGQGVMPSYEDIRQSWQPQQSSDEPPKKQRKKLSRVQYRKRQHAHRVSMVLTGILMCGLAFAVVWILNNGLDLPYVKALDTGATIQTLDTTEEIMDIVNIDGQPTLVAWRNGVMNVVDFESEYGQFITMDEDGNIEDYNPTIDFYDEEDENDEPALPMDIEDIEELATVIIEDEEGIAAVAINGSIVLALEGTDDAKWVKEKLFEPFNEPQQADALHSIGFSEKFEVMTLIDSVDIVSKEEAYLYLQDRLTVLTTEELKTKETLKYETKYIDDPTRASGSSKTVQDGKNGSRSATYIITYSNGKEQSRKLKAQEIFEEPRAKIVNRGTKKSSSSSNSSSNSSSGSNSNTFTGPLTSGKSGPNEGARGKDQGSLSFMWPISSKVSSNFGPRWGRIHYGIDIPAKTGTNIYASESGTVTSYYGTRGDYGLLVELDHGNGFRTRYAHCSKLLVNVGDKVSKGDVIALVGNTGNSSGPHLHFEIRVDGEAYNPRFYLNDGFKY